jgi:hypothetical protein
VVRFLRPTANLASIVNDDFRSAVVRNDVTPNLHALSLQGTEVAEAALVRRKDHTGKWAGAIILAKIQKRVS